jgi:hypothetical protein
VSLAVRLAAAAFGALLLGSLACDRATTDPLPIAEPPLPDPAHDLFDGKALGEAVVSLKSAARSPVQAISLLVRPDRVVLQAQDRARPAEVGQYVYRSGKVNGPVSVKLMGTGKLEDNLFPLDAAKLGAVPALIGAAKAQVKIPGAKLDRVLLKRNLPESMDIQFRVFFTANGREAFVDADKDGNVLE